MPKEKQLDKAIEQYLKEIYYNPIHPGSFGGTDKTYREAVAKFPQVTRHAVKKWLGHQDAWSLNKPIKRVFKRRPVITSGLGTSFECDLIDFVNIKDSNNKYSYILLVLDQFSRYLWGRKLISKAPSVVAVQMDKILKESGPCFVLYHDAGSEWKGDFQTLINEYKIKSVTKRNELHANYVERAIGSLKTRLFRYFEYKQTRKWINVFQSFIQSYNNTYHRSLQAKPVDITPKNEVDFWVKQYYKTPKI